VLKVLDFGIARLTDDTSSATSTKTGQTVGTPAFMSPEQALSRPRDVDARTDIWSVGATLFTLLSGEHVHLAESSSEHLVKAATLHARSLARALPGVPSNVEALVARCLSFDKNERWASATSMRAELTHVRSDPGRRLGTSTSPPPERTSDRPSDEMSDASMSLNSDPGAFDLIQPRRKWLLPFAVTSTLMLILMSGVVLVLAVRTPSQPPTVGARAPSSAASSPRTMPSEPEPAPPAGPPSVAGEPLGTPTAPAVRPASGGSAAVIVSSPRTNPSGGSVKKRPAHVPAKGPVNKDVYRPF
jgi:serine/threonine-protein kinase